LAALFELVTEGRDEEEMKDDVSALAQERILSAIDVIYAIDAKLYLRARNLSPS
jgi:hypothetical protein